MAQEKSHIGTGRAHSGRLLCCSPAWALDSGTEPSIHLQSGQLPFLSVSYSEVLCKILRKAFHC